MAYSPIYEGTMTDKWLVALPIEKRYLWVYLLACDERRTEGLFRLNVWTASKACSMNPDHIVATLADWTMEGRIVYSEAEDLIWFPRANKYWKTQNVNDAKGVVKRLSSHKNHYLIGLVWGAAIKYGDERLADALGEYCSNLSTREPVPPSVAKRFPEESNPW